MCMSSKGQAFALPSYDEIPLSEHRQTLKLVLEVCQSQQERIALLEETVAQLKDEIAILKGEKPRPTIKPSTLNQDQHAGEGPSRGEKGKDRGAGPGKKPKELEIHETQILQPEPLPAGSVFKGSEDYLVQGLRIRLHNTQYRRARYHTPQGETLLGELPAAVRGSHFDPELRSYILLQYYQQHTSQQLILKELEAFGVQISSGQLNRLIPEGHESFHAEKAELLRVGLAVSSYINVDDTAARHQGQNGYCTPSGHELFAWFASTESKSRINFLELLRRAYRLCDRRRGPGVYATPEAAPGSAASLGGGPSLCRSSRLGSASADPRDCHGAPPQNRYRRRPRGQSPPSRCVA